MTDGNDGQLLDPKLNVTLTLPRSKFVLRLDDQSVIVIPGDGRVDLPDDEREDIRASYAVSTVIVAPTFMIYSWGPSAEVKTPAEV